MLNLPQTTEFNKRVPKQKFYEHLLANAKIKSLFAAQIKTIYETLIPRHENARSRRENKLE